MKSKKNIKEVALVFFRLGLFAFGGPAAHIAMMEEEIIEKRKWISRQHFLDLVGATNLIPGPNSTEMTMHCGHERAGIWGLFVAGFCFILPAVTITAFFAWLYTEYGDLPQIEPFFIGIKPAVLAIIFGAIFKLGKKALKNWQLGILGVLVVTATLLGVNEVTALLSAGLLGMIFFYTQGKVREGNIKSFIPLVILQTPAAVIVQLSSLKVFLTFLKVGAILYGSGYVLFAYLDAELVSTGLLSRQELIDAIAVGQFTPGPVLSTATFIGYQLNGFSGALAATAGIFLPSFLFVFILNPLVPKMRKSKLMSAFLDSVNVAAVGIMITVLFNMSIDVLVDWKSILIAALSFGFMFGIKKMNSMIIIVGGAILGYVLYLI